MERISANNVLGIEKWIFYFLCGFALFSSTSIAMGNVFLSLAIVAGAVRLWKKHDDIRVRDLPEPHRRVHLHDLGGGHAGR